MIRRGAIVVPPNRITKSRTSGANVGVAVVTIDAPRLQDAVHVSFVAGTPNVIHDFVVALLLQGLANTAGDVIEHFIPLYPRPSPFSPSPFAFQRIKNAIGIGNLIDRRRPFRAVAPTASGMIGIALELAHLQRRLVDITQQPAARFAIETRRRHHHVMFGFSPRPAFGFLLYPVVPFLWRRVAG